MKKAMVILMFGFIAAAWSPRTAQALPKKFKDAFADKYAANHKSEEFKAAVKKASCNACHVKGAKKEVNNDFGEELKKLIEGEAYDRVKAARSENGREGEEAEYDKLLVELEAAFKKVEEMKSPTGETFGQRIKEGKLPVDVDWAAEQYKQEKAKQRAAGN